jgi:hypothetical protein
MTILIGRFLAKRNLKSLQDSLQMKLIRRADGDPVTRTSRPFKEDENSLLSEFWVGCLLDFKKDGG